MPLYLNSANLVDISEAIIDAGECVMDAFVRVSDNSPESIRPDMITEALCQLIDIMHMIEQDQASDLAFRDTLSDITNGSPLLAEPLYEESLEYYEPLDSNEISEIGNHGLSLIQTLSEWARNLNLYKEVQQLQAVMVLVSLWIARHGGYLTTLDIIVDTLADMANKTSDCEVLKELSYVMDEIINAVDEDIRISDCKSDQPNPWRILNINHGIIAARTYDPSIMEPAFEQLAMNIPEDASSFFEKGVTQMVSLDYPSHIKAIMNRYFLQYSSYTVH